MKSRILVAVNVRSERRRLEDEDCQAVRLEEEDCQTKLKL